MRLDERTKFGECGDRSRDDSGFAAPKLAGDALPLHRVWNSPVAVLHLHSGDQRRQKITKQLARMQALGLGADVILCDGGSSDGSTDPERLRDLGVRALLVKTGAGQAQRPDADLFAYALEEGYEGVVTIDGNGKDGVEAIPTFLQALADGFDFVQGSRYVPGGKEENTPLDRKLGLKFLHAPLISLAAGFRYPTLPTAFAPFSPGVPASPGSTTVPRRFRHLQPALLLIYSCAPPGTGSEGAAVTRCYPKTGPTPSKISGLVGQAGDCATALECGDRRYNPPS